MTRLREAGMSQPLKALWAALAIVIVCGSLAACGGGSSSSGAASGSASASTSGVSNGGVLTVGAAAQGFPQLNPALATFAWEETLWPLLWDGLTKYEEDGSLGPDLATSWKSSDANSEWTFQLRPGVKFSNGKPVTAADVASAFQYYLKPSTTFFLKDEIEPIKSATARGPQTLALKLSKADAYIPEAVSNVMIMYLPALAGINKQPIGTGPFVVKSYVPNGALNLVPNRGYWGTAPHVDEIRFSNISDPTAAFTDLKSGNLDVFYSVPYSDAPGIEGDPKLKLLKPAIRSQTNYWDLDNSSPPFNNIKARQALAYAADRTAMLQSAYFGQGLVSPTNNFLTTENPAYNKSLTPYPYDLAKAKTLFEEAGVKNLTWWGVAGAYPEWNTMGQILQASLSQIGVNLKIDNVDINTWAAKFFPAGKKYPGLIVPNLNTTPPQPAYLLNYPLKGTCECNYNNATYNRIYDEALGARSETERTELWDKLQEMINQEVPIIEPLQANTVTARQSTIDGVWVEGSGRMHLEKASIAGG